MSEGKKNSTIKILVISIVAIFGLIGMVLAFNFYQLYFKSNVHQEGYLYIATGAEYKAVLDSLQKNGLVDDLQKFDEAAHKMNYIKRVKPGRYRLREGMNNRQMINMLASSTQEPVKISFQNLRLKENLAASIGKSLEADSLSVIKLLDSTEFISQYGFNKDNVYVMFLPNTYQMYWNTNSEQFFKKIHKEYLKFWNTTRQQKAKELGISPIEVSVLASIVDAEALMDKEMNTIAGLYLNRLHKGMKLESDPTVIFATKDFTIRRVLNKHLQVNSPYNTYRYQGLPPGPIMMPSIKAIDAVLNYEKHPYIYMCAKEDFSGTHNFAISMSEHLANAKKFQRALDERNIKK